MFICGRRYSVEYTNIKLEKENRVATIRLNRPDNLNALSPEVLAELSSGVAEAGEDQSIKALVLRGASGHSGFDRFQDSC